MNGAAKVIGAALQEHLVGLRLVLLGIGHAASRPVVELIDDLLHTEFTLHAVELFSPFLQTAVTLVIDRRFARHHLEVRSRQRDAVDSRDIISKFVAGNGMQVRRVARPEPKFCSFTFFFNAIGVPV